MTLDRVNFRLTMQVSDHPRNGRPSETVVETFANEQALLDRYDVVVAEDDRLRRQITPPVGDARLAEFPEGNGKGEV